MGKQRLEDKLIFELCKKYTEYKLTTTEIAKLFNLTQPQVYHYIKEKGLIRTKEEIYKLRFQDKKIKAIENIQYLFNEGKSINEISKELNVSTNYIYSKGLSRNKLLTPLSKEELGRIYGTLLGDSCISYADFTSKTPRITMTHGLIQKEYVKFKHNNLPNLRGKISTRINQGFGDFSSVYVSTSHKDLIEVLNVVKNKQNKKMITTTWLNKISEEGLAWWYMDDGSLNFSGNSPIVSLHTEGFSEIENIKLCEWLNNLGYKAKIEFSKKKKLYLLKLNVSSSKDWVNNLSKFMCKKLEYKFDLNKNKILYTT